MRPSTIAKVLAICSILAEFSLSYAQSVTFSIDTQSQRNTISPLIYGYNAYADGTGRTGWDNQGGEASLLALNMGSRRLGGNNMTSYNWENGVSNSGMDWCNSSNAGVSYATGAGAPNNNAGLAYYLPGAAIKAFHSQSITLGTYSLLQLPAAGKLPKDIVNLNPPGNCNGSQLWQSAPGASNVDLTRWVTIVNNKPASAGALTTTPVISDGNVYIDEEINFLLKNFGKASTVNGVKAYELDNEPDLWHLWPSQYGDGTHPLLYPNLTTIGDVVQKNLNLATTVKRMDSSAETYGPAVSGYLGLFSLWAVWDGSQTRQPSDWATYNVEPYLTNKTGDRYRYNGMTFANVYLDHMRKASTSAGHRLLDTLSFHYYPQASSTPADRVQASRSLWDANYVEPSWITQAGYGFTDGRGLELIPKLKQSVADFYPGTKLAITEYDFGGKTDVTGVIAQADALGAFGQQGVYMASYFGDVEGYIAAGFKLYRNYDGNKSVFPEVSVKAVSTNNGNGTVYAAVSANDPNTLHVIAINRLSTALTASVQIKSPVAFKNVQTWGVDASSQNVTPRNSVAGILNNTFSYTLPAQSVMHFVLKP